MSFISTELNLDRDVPDGEILVESSDKPVVVDYLEEIMWVESDTSHEILTPINELVDVTMENEVQKVEAMYGC
jgi:hypothetical protein